MRDTEPLIDREQKSGFGLGTKVAATVGLIVLLVVGLALYPRDVQSSMAYTPVQEAVVCGANEGSAWCGITCGAVGVDPCAPATATLCANTGTLPASTQVTGGGWAAVEFTVGATPGPVMNVAYSGGATNFANGVIETVAVGTTLELQLTNGGTLVKKFGTVTANTNYFAFFTVTVPPSQILAIINVAESATNAQLAPYVDAGAATTNTFTLSGFSGGVTKLAYNTNGISGQPGAFPPNTLFGTCATTTTQPPPPPTTTTAAPVTTKNIPPPPPPPPATTKKATPKPQPTKPQPPKPKPKPRPRPRRPRGSSSSS